MKLVVTRLETRQLLALVLSLGRPMVIAGAMLHNGPASWSADQYFW